VSLLSRQCRVLLEVAGVEVVAVEAADIGVPARGSLPLLARIPSLVSRGSSKKGVGGSLVGVGSVDASCNGLKGKLLLNGVVILAGLGCCCCCCKAVEEADEADEAPTLPGLRETGLSTGWIAETQLCCELGREGKRRHWLDMEVGKCADVEDGRAGGGGLAQLVRLAPPPADPNPVLLPPELRPVIKGLVTRLLLVADGG